LRPLGLVRIVDFRAGKGADYGVAPGQAGVEFTITEESGTVIPSRGSHLCFRAGHSATFEVIGPRRSRRYWPMPLMMRPMPLKDSPEKKGASEAKPNTKSGWSCRFWPTPGRWCTLAMPCLESAELSPIPDSISK